MERLLKEIKDAAKEVACNMASVLSDEQLLEILTVGSEEEKEIAKNVLQKRFSYKEKVENKEEDLEEFLIKFIKDFKQAFDAFKESGLLPKHLSFDECMSQFLREKIEELYVEETEESCCGCDCCCGFDDEVEDEEKVFNLVPGGIYYEANKDENYMLCIVDSDLEDGELYACLIRLSNGNRMTSPMSLSSLAEFMIQDCFDWIHLKDAKVFVE